MACDTHLMFHYDDCSGCVHEKAERIAAKQRARSNSAYLDSLQGSSPQRGTRGAGSAPWVFAAGVLVGVLLVLLVQTQLLS